MLDLIDKTVVEFERTDLSIESSMGKELQASSAMEKSFTKGRVSQCSKLDCCLVF